MNDMGNLIIRVVLTVGLLFTFIGVAWLAVLGFNWAMVFLSVYHPAVKATVWLALGLALLTIGIIGSKHT